MGSVGRMRDERLDAAIRGLGGGADGGARRGAPGDRGPRTDMDLAEGYRWVTRLSRLAQEWFLEKSDPLHPGCSSSRTTTASCWSTTPTCATGSACSTTPAPTAYRVPGRGAYVGLTFGTPIGQGPVGGRTGTTTQAHLDQFELGPDGEVDVLIAADRPCPIPSGELGRARAGHWAGGLPRDLLRQAPERSRGCRSSWCDRRRGSATGLSSDDLAAKLEFAALFVQFVAATAVNMWHDTADNINTFGGHGRLGARRRPGRRDALPQRRRDDLPRRTVRARRGPGPGGHGARARQGVPLLGAHHRPARGWRATTTATPPRA